MNSAVSTPELNPGESLHEWLSLHTSSGGVNAVRKLAAVSVGGVDADHASVLGKKVAEWAGADFARELEKALEPDPFMLMVKAWSQVRKLRQAAEESRGPPPQKKTEALLEHEIDLTLEPRLVLNVDGVDWCSIKLEVAIKLSFASAQFEFDNGRVTALQLGKPTGSVTLKCEGHEVAEFKRDIKLHAAYHFKPALAWP
jgi:hypothetical protein